MKELSIVAICIDPDLPIFERFISSVKQYTLCDYELIIVDNAGENIETSAQLKQNSDKYIRLDNRISVGAAWNKGINEAEGNYILVTNDDVVVSRNWFEQMREVFTSYPETGMVVPVMNYSLLEQTHIGDVFHIDEACPIKITPFKQFVWGAFMLFKKESFSKVNNFSEDFDIAGGEDIDMCFKLFEEKLDIYVDHRVFIYHEWGSTGVRILGDKRRKELYKENFRKFKQKWIKYTYDW